MASTGSITLARKALAALTVFRDATGGPVTDAELETLAAWPGWGPLAPAFDPRPEGTWAEIADTLADLLDAEAMTDARDCVDNSFYTPAVGPARSCPAAPPTGRSISSESNATPPAPASPHCCTRAPRSSTNNSRRPRYAACSTPSSATCRSPVRRSTTRPTRTAAKRCTITSSGAASKRCAKVVTSPS